MARYRCPACGLERDIDDDREGLVVRHVRCPETLGTIPVVMTTEPHPCRPAAGGGTDRAA